jgi:cysteinyl-tRNA synthetase
VDGAKIAIYGRPGWHIECSAMSEVHLGEVFDIHGGGLDLIFPHHENEIAQSRCAYGHDVMANVWMHNGFLQVEGKKMSKSEGNFVTIHELLHTEKFGGRMWAGPVLRYAMLMKNYREPLDFTEKGLLAAYADLAVLSTTLSNASYHEDQDELHWRMWRTESHPSRELIEALSDDLDTRSALMSITDRGKYLSKDDAFGAMLIANDLRFMGLMDETNHPLLSGTTSTMQFGSVPPELFDLASPLVRRKRIAFMNGNVDLVSEIDAELERLGFAESEYSGGSFDLRYVGPKTESIDEIVEKRLELLKTKNFAEADKIRDDLLTKGIQLKDGKDPATGERVTTWEVKR